MAMIGTILLNNKIAKYPYLRRFNVLNGLLTGVGKVVDESIVLDAKPGDVVSFGPYADLEPWRIQYID